MNIEDMATQIAIGQYNDTELNKLAEAIIFARKQLEKRSLVNVRVGSNVRWESNKTGQSMTGVVKKVARTKVHVSVDGVLWAVPGSMVTVI
jgi:hypothetical protein